MTSIDPVTASLSLSGTESDLSNLPVPQVGLTGTTASATGSDFDLLEEHASALAMEFQLDMPFDLADVFSDKLKSELPVGLGPGLEACSAGSTVSADGDHAGPSIARITASGSSVHCQWQNFRAVVLGKWDCKGCRYLKILLTGLFRRPSGVQSSEHERRIDEVVRLLMRDEDDLLKLWEADNCNLSKQKRTLLGFITDGRQWAMRPLVERLIQFSVLQPENAPGWVLAGPLSEQARGLQVEAATSSGSKPVSQVGPGLVLTSEMVSEVQRLLKASPPLPRIQPVTRKPKKGTAGGHGHSSEVFALKGPQVTKPLAFQISTQFQAPDEVSKGVPGRRGLGGGASGSRIGGSAGLTHGGAADIPCAASSFVGVLVLPPRQPGDDTPQSWDIVRVRTSDMKEGEASACSAIVRAWRDAHRDDDVHRPETTVTVTVQRLTRLTGGSLAWPLPGDLFIEDQDDPKLIKAFLQVGGTKKQKLELEVPLAVHPAAGEGGHSCGGFGDGAPNPYLPTGTLAIPDGAGVVSRGRCASMLKDGAEVETCTTGMTMTTAPPGPHPANGAGRTSGESEVPTELLQALKL